MSKTARRTRSKSAPAAAVATVKPKSLPVHFWPLAALAAAVLVFYWIPLTSENTSIQWDAVDYHYNTLKYFADSVKAGRLPSWTPYIFSGFPFLSDSQSGVWYPLNWPLFLFGVTPWSLQASLAAHCLLAAWGMYLLAFRFLRRPWAAVLAGGVYAFSGFFAGHSSHLGMFQTAALLPWLLFALSRAFDTRRAAWVAAAGALAGFIILAGHFQTALYACFAGALFAAAEVIADRKRARVVAVCLLLAFAAGAVLSSIEVIPGLELVRHSIRATQSYTKTTNSPLVPSALSTLVYADALGAVSGNYHGPEDITQFYLYAGVALLPLALLGLRNAAVRLPALVLFLPTVWYALGPKAGFYTLVASLPGFASVRAPVHIWFVPALALALLAGSGFHWLGARFKNRYVACAILVFCFVDVWYWNSLTNPLAYARTSFQQQYGQDYDFFRNQIAPHIPALTRLHLAAPNARFGPLNDPLEAKVETTYGYNPLEIAAYADYIAMSEANPRLLDTLSVRYRALPGQNGIHENPGALARALFPRHVIAVPDQAGARQATSRLNPAQDAVLIAREAPLQDASASAAIVDFAENGFRVRYKSGSQSLLRIGMPFFPGWRAEVDGQAYDVAPVDYALAGVVAPAGEHDMVFAFHTPGLWLGALLSALGALLCSGVAIWDLRRRPPCPGSPTRGSGV